MEAVSVEDVEQKVGAACLLVTFHSCHARPARPRALAFSWENLNP